MRPLYRYLTYAGLLPFLFGATCLNLSIDTLPHLGATQDFFSAYAVVIAAFMAGSHWGQHLHLGHEWRVNLMLSSNAIAVALWLSFVTQPFHTFLVSVTVLFLILLMTDQRLARHKLITQDYFRTRCIATTIVIATLIIVGSSR